VKDCQQKSYQQHSIHTSIEKRFRNGSFHRKKPSRKCQEDTKKDTICPELLQQAASRAALFRTRPE